MTEDNFAKLPLLGEEEEEFTTVPTFKPTKGTGRKHKNASRSAQAPAPVKQEPAPAVDVTHDMQQPVAQAQPVSKPSGDDGGIQSFLDAFSDIIEIVPDYANDAARLAASARTILPLKAPTAALIVGAVAALAAYAAVGRDKQ